MKYPRTAHLPFSPSFLRQESSPGVLQVGEPDVGISADSASSFTTEEVVITEKLDGGNCAIHQGRVYGRSHAEEASHPSFGPIKQLATQIRYILEGEDADLWLFGENLFGIHSIEYDGLESFFYLFGALRGTRWVSWDEVERIAELTGIPTVPLLHRGRMTSLAEIEPWMASRLSGSSSRVGSTHPEGFVIRVAREFDNKDFERCVAKYVRENHIQTDETWRRTWKSAKLK